MYVIDTVVTLGGLSAVLVIACLCDVVQLAPCERCLAVTDVDGIVLYVIGLVDEEMQTVDTIATELALIDIFIIAGGV